MKKKPKYKPRREELLHYQEDVKDGKGREYGLSVRDKVADDGVTEAHFDYTPHFRPKGIGPIGCMMRAPKANRDNSIQYDPATRTWWRWDRKKNRMVRDRKKRKP
jgi:hypothetical protein